MWVSLIIEQTFYSFIRAENWEKPFMEAVLPPSQMVFLNKKRTMNTHPRHEKINIYLSIYHHNHLHNLQRPSSLPQYFWSLWIIMPFDKGDHHQQHIFKGNHHHNHHHHFHDYCHIFKVNHHHHRHIFKGVGGGGGFKPRQQQLSTSPSCKVRFILISLSDTQWVLPISVSVISILIIHS